MPRGNRGRGRGGSIRVLTARGGGRQQQHQQQGKKPQQPRRDSELLPDRPPLSSEWPRSSELQRVLDIVNGPDPTQPRLRRLSPTTPEWPSSGKLGELLDSVTGPNPGVPLQQRQSQAPPTPDTPESTVSPRLQELWDLIDAGGTTQPRLERQPPPQLQVQSLAAVSHSGTVSQGLILHLLDNINQAFLPVLSDSRLQDIYNEITPHTAQWIGHPVHDDLYDLRYVLAEAVSHAKASTRDNKLEDISMSTPLTARAQMATPRIGQFLLFINGFIGERNEKSLTAYVALEPPFDQGTVALIQELQGAYPRGSEEALEQRCTQVLKKAVEGDEGGSWTPFIKFMAQYLAYLRDVSADPNRYLETYALLSELQQRANSALGHSSLGYLVLPIVIANAKLVCRLAIGLDKQPELIAHLRRSGGGGGGDESGARETLPERAANILRQAFVTCLNDRNANPGADSKPEGKKRGIYIIANLCLKILFQCRKTRNATQIFENISNLSPPLSAYPKGERVTYLYYLGRIFFQNSHFYRAKLALQHAYDTAPARPECAKQRRHILVYLIASNLILGRYPSRELLNRPEAQGLAERFVPLCLAIRQGNLPAFRRHLDLDGEHAEWFLHFRILLQLRNRCEVLVWRSLVRKVYRWKGHNPQVAKPGTNSAATLNLDYLVQAFSTLEEPSIADHDGYIDPDFADVHYGEADTIIGTTAIESKLASLIDQGLINGFVAHKQRKFVIKGVRQNGGDAVAAGFPNVWSVLKNKVEGSGADVVPGWKKQQDVPSYSKFGPGMVHTFSSMQPVGA